MHSARVPVSLPASLSACSPTCLSVRLSGEQLLGGAWLGGAVASTGAGGAVFKLVPEFMYKRLLLAQLPQGLLPAEMAEVTDRQMLGWMDGWMTLRTYR